MTEEQIKTIAQLFADTESIVKQAGIFNAVAVLFDSAAADECLRMAAMMRHGENVSGDFEDVEKSDTHAG